MSTGFTTRRRADRFDALLGDPGAGSDDPRFAELLEVVSQLRDVQPPRPRANFSASLRENLMAEADTVLLPHDRAADDRLTLPTRTARTARSPRDRRLAVAAGALAMVGATTSMAVAAQTALPGDTLYPVKRALEDVHAGVSMGDAARGSTLLANASGRLDEASELARIGTEDSLAGAPEALVDFVDQAQEGSSLLLADYEETGDASSVETVRDFAGTSLAVLETLQGELPSDADDELLRAAEVLAEIDARAAALCPTCGGLGIAEIPPSLASAITGEEAAGTSSLPIQPAQPGQPVQPVQPGQPFQPKPSEAGADTSAGGGSSGGDGSTDRGIQLPDLGGVLPPGSVTSDGGSGAGGVVEDLTGGVLGDGGPAGEGSDQLLQPLKETGEQVDQLLSESGLVDGQPTKKLNQGSGSKGSGGGKTGGPGGGKTGGPGGGKIGGSGGGSGGALDGLLGD